MLVDAVGVGVGAGEERGVGDAGDAGLGRMAPEDDRVLAELAQRRGVRDVLVVGLDEVLVERAGRVEHDQARLGDGGLVLRAGAAQQASEREASRAVHYTVENWIAPEGVTIREVDGDREIAPGLTLLFTPGHTPGHQSLLVETLDGPLIVGAQAAYTAAEFEVGGDLAEAHEDMGETYRASIERLKSLAPTRVFFSHDRREWPG